MQVLMYHLLPEDLPTEDATYSTALSDLESYPDFVNPDKICGRADSKYVLLKVCSLVEQRRSLSIAPISCMVKVPHAVRLMSSC